MARRGMMRGLTKYTGRAKERREGRVISYSEATNPCGLTIRKITRLCARGYEIQSRTCRVPIKELWRYREFSWNTKVHEGTDRPNYGTWRELEDWMRETKWANSEPLDFLINPQAGVAKVANGNHRLMLARKLRIKTAPVSFRCDSHDSDPYDMLRPDWAVAKETERVTRMRRRTWKKIEGGYAKYFHKEFRRMHKEIAALKKHPRVATYFKGAPRACGPEPPKAPRRISKYEGAAQMAWVSLYDDHIRYRKCLFRLSQGMKP